MSKYATKKATEQLQKIFDVLGEFGGVIETDAPRCYWSLDLEVEEIEGDIKTIKATLLLHARTEDEIEKINWRYELRTPLFEKDDLVEFYFDNGKKKTK